MSRPFIGTPRLVAMRCCAGSRRGGIRVAKQPWHLSGAPPQRPQGARIAKKIGTTPEIDAGTGAA